MAGPSVACIGRLGGVRKGEKRPTPNGVGLLSDSRQNLRSIVTSKFRGNFGAIRSSVTPFV